MKRILFKAVCSGVVLFAMLSCRGKEAEVSSSADIASVDSGSNGTGAFAICPCKDLACWRKETDSRQKDVFKCASKAVGKALPILDIPISIAIAATDIAAASTALEETASAAAETSAVGKLLKESVPKGGSCVADLFGLISGSSSLVKNVIGNTQKAVDVGTKAAAGEIDFEAAKDVLKSFITMGKSIVKLIGDIPKCQECINGLTGNPVNVANLKTWWSNFSSNLLKAGKKFSELDKIGKLDIYDNLATCGISIFRGASAVGQNFGCMLDDLDDVAASNAAVGKALAYVGTRLFNKAKYDGCTQCVRNTGAGGDTDYNNCRSCCETQARENIFEGFTNTKASYQSSCQLTCAIVKSDGYFFGPYTDPQKCEDTKNTFYVSRTYRYIELFDRKATDKLASVEFYRAILVKHLDTLYANFSKLDQVLDGKIDGFATFRDLIALSESPDVSDDIRQAAAWFSKRFIGADNMPYYYNFLVSAGNEGRNGQSFSEKDILYFRDEVREFRDESEY